MPLTRIPERPSSSARVLVMLASPAFDAEYDAQRGLAADDGARVDIDDLAVALRPHRRDSCLDDPHRPEEVDREDALPLVDVRLFEHREVALVMTVVHQDVQPAVVIDRAFHEPRA